MAALSALVFSLSWWLGLYLLARDPRKPVLVLAAVGLTSFAAVVALDAVRMVVSGSDLLEQHRDLSGRGAGHRLVRGARSSCPGRATPGAAGQARSSLIAGVAALALRRRGDGGQRRRPAAAGPLGDVRRHLAVVAGRDAAGGVRTVAAAAGGGLPRGRDVVLRARQRDPRHPARARAQLACPGVHRVRRRAARRRGRDVGRVRRRPGAARRHAALVRRDGRGGRAVRRPGVDRHGVDGGADGADRAAVHQRRDRDLDQRAGRPTGRAARPARVLPLAGSARRPRGAAPHRGRAAAAVGQPARRASTTTPSPGSPVARSATTATCPSWSPAR